MTNLDQLFVLSVSFTENCTTSFPASSGQTGSGKTFTMMGPAEDSENLQHELRGIIPRTFEYLFNHIERQKELVGLLIFIWVTVGVKMPNYLS